MKIWIDAETGTWGSADELFVIDTEDGPESAMLEHALDGYSDAQISEYARQFGTPVR